jgi:molecular chaperone GrpE
MQESESPMNIKYPFSPQSRHMGEEDMRQEDDGYEEQRRTQENGQARRQASKGHAAYAAKDKDLAAPPPHGAEYAFREECAAGDAVEADGHGAQADNEGALLTKLTKEALQAECRIRLCPECPLKKEADDVRLRSLAELDNARKRLSRERDEQVRFAAEAVLADILPSLDNLDLALLHAGDNSACKDLLVGLQMTRKLLFEALQKQGLELVGAVGELFNPAVHEAVGMSNAPEVPEGHVCSLISKGYKLKDRLLQPARVIVCKKD